MEHPVYSDVQASPPVAPAEGRGALRVVALGAVAIVLAAATYRAFELDRFFVPKELVLHLTALVGGLLALRLVRRLAWTWVDTLLVIYLGAGIVSAVLAQNGWLATRALTISASSIAVFWIARALNDAGRSRQLLAAIAVAVVAGAVTSLLQTYGVRTDVFSINRAPGGTLGNRNSIAHMAAFGLPVVLLVAVTSRHMLGYLLGAVGSMLVVATLVLTRSRAGWLAVAAAIAILAGALILSAPARRHAWLRLSGIAVVLAAGIAAAILLPNSLRWVDENPYLSSVRDVANYREGSGAGRLVQYRQSLQMAVDNPLFGVGPGNWGVVYPEHAARRDPSMDRSEGGRTSNPWPSSDWVAFASERGAPALLLLIAALGGIALTTLRRLVTATEGEEALNAATLLATLGAALVAGLFDAVLLLALPALLVWAALGALWAPLMVEQISSGTRAAFAFVVVLLISGLGALRSTSELVAMGIYANTQNNSWLQRAAWIDPGNYRLRIRLARGGSGLPRARRCEHALAARDLYPSASQARSLSRSCGD